MKYPYLNFIWAEIWVMDYKPEILSLAGREWSIITIRSMITKNYSNNSNSIPPHPFIPYSYGPLPVI